MKCKKIKDELVNNVNHSFTEIDDDTLRLHIDNCASCKESRSQIMKTYAFIEAMREHSPETSHFFTEIVMAKIQSHKNVEFSIRQWLINELFMKKSILATSLFSIFAGILFGLLIHRSMPSEFSVTSLSQETQTIEELYWAGISYTNITEFFKVQEQNIYLNGIKDGTE
jgi:hypothetical protein